MPKTQVAHPKIVHRIAPGFLIWKMLSDLPVIFFIRELVLKVLVASATEVMCPQGHCGKVKLLDFSINALRTLPVIDIPNLSITSLNPNILKPIWDALVASLTSLTLPHQ